MFERVGEGQGGEGRGGVREGESKRESLRVVLYREKISQGETGCEAEVADCTLACWASCSGREESCAETVKTRCERRCLFYLGLLGFLQRSRQALHSVQ